MSLMAKKTLKDYADISIKPESLIGRLDFDDIFGRKGGVHIEIGSGKGTFLLSQAGFEPEINFLGIEWANKYYRHAVDRMGRWGVKNVRIIRTDAAVFLSEHVPDESINCFHIYFPDPWPKKRHHKRRFVRPANMTQMLRCLRPGGIINIATDHADYFEQITHLVSAEIERHSLEPIDFILTAGAAASEAAGTNYERKYLKAGRQIYTIATKKTTNQLSQTLF